MIRLGLGWAAGGSGDTPPACPRIPRRDDAGHVCRFRPGEAPDEWIQDRWIEDAWTPFFTYGPRPGDERVRQAPYQRHHVSGESFVVSSLTLVRYEEHQVLQLRNEEFTRHTDEGKEKVQVTTAEEYARIVAEEFRLPAMPILEGVAAWQEQARDLPEPWTPRPGA